MAASPRLKEETIASGGKDKKNSSRRSNCVRTLCQVDEVRAAVSNPGTVNRRAAGSRLSRWRKPRWAGLYGSPTSCLWGGRIV